MDDEPVIEDAPDFDEPGDGPDLSGDEAEFLLDELEEFVSDVEPGVGAVDPAARDEMNRLLDGLEGVVAPVARDPAIADGIASWTRVLMHEGDHDELGGPEEVRASILELLDDLRDTLRLS